MIAGFTLHLGIYQFYIYFCFRYDLVLCGRNQQAIGQSA
jgi:hypothetical protein